MTVTRSRDYPALNVIESGNGGECAVFLHGLGGTHRYWNCGPQPLQFSGRRTSLIDLLGFGDSPRPSCCDTVDQHLDALHSILYDKRNMTLDACLFIACMAPSTLRPL